MSEKDLVSRLFDNPYFQDRLKDAEILGARSERYRSFVAQMLTEKEQAETIAQAIRVVHLVQRLQDISVLQLDDNDAVFAAMNDAENFPLWDAFGTFDAEGDVSDEDKEYLADLLYHGDPAMQTPLVITLADHTASISERVVRMALQQGDAAQLRIQDNDFFRRVMRNINPDQAAKWGRHAAQYYVQSKRSIFIDSGASNAISPDPAPPKDVAAPYRSNFMETRKNNDPNQFFTLTRLPTAYDAFLDQMDYALYKKRFMESVKVDRAQQDRANRVLIAKLNAASIVRIRNNDGTDVTFDITGQTFANSLTNRNVPGSEVFSSPLLNSANGRIVAKGRFMPMEADQMIEDITLDLKDGVIISYDAAKGREYLAQMIETDEGSRRIGELALGTNPAWRDHSVNGLLVEKIGGSFHFALGRAYTDTEYMGEPVKLDNGNRSAIHWDITVMLHNKQGMIELDGVPIMENGRYLDPELQFLNVPSAKYAA